MELAEEYLPQIEAEVSLPPQIEVEQIPLVELFLRYLKAEGVRFVFGVPGGLLHPFFEAVEQDADLELLVTKHECGAAFMADGYARMGKGFAVAAATSGPGATNLMTGVGVAFTDGVPMLVVTGQAPSQSLGKGAAQETPPDGIDIVSMFRPITKYSAMVVSPDSVAHHLRKALRCAFSGRPGPVHLNVPVDYWMKTVKNTDWLNPETYRTNSRSFDREAVKNATDLLFNAVRPGILVGSGCATPEAQFEVVRLAETLGAIVATTPRAKGIFPEDHPLSLGVFGMAGHAAARKFFLGPQMDVLLVAGASLNETTTFNWNPALAERRSLIHLDIDSERIGRNYPVQCGLCGDAATILHELWYHLQCAGKGSGGLPSRRELPVSAANYQYRYAHQDRRESERVPLQPERWRAELCDVLPENAVIFSDIGGHMLFNIHHLLIKSKQRFILNFGFGSMGHGTAAPIGAALADRSRPVISIVGDGCFCMNGMDLLTACEYDIPVIWIVENNQMHGITWHGSKVVNNGRGMSSIIYRHPPQIGEMAKAMGLAVWRVEKPGQIAQALRQALAFRAPTVIEVLSDKEVAPPMEDRAKTIVGIKRQ